MIRKLTALASAASLAAFAIVSLAHQTATAGEEKPATATVAATATAAAEVAEVGKPAPNFTLTDTEGKVHTLADLKGKIVVLEWFNPECPFVQKHHVAHKSMAGTYAAATKAGAVWFAVNSAAPGKQGHGVERNTQVRKEYGIAYPILLDESGSVGKAYGAKTTPHMFVINPEGVLVYAGAIDNNRSSSDLGDQNYVLGAVQACQAAKAVGTATTQPYGCSVKYAS